MSLWFVDSWKEFRPYGVHLTKDFFISGYIWVLLFLYGLLRITFPIHGWEGEFITHLHGVLVVLTYMSFFLLGVADIYKLMRAKA